MSARCQRHPRLALIVLFLTAALAAQEPAGDRFAREIRPFLAASCTSCHSGAAPDGGLDLEAWGGPAGGIEDVSRLRLLRDRVRNGEMPPPDAPALTADARQAFLAAAADELADAAQKLPLDPGRVTMRRLSRFEYDNTVRDLLGVRTELSKLFPNEDLGYGFDNVGDASSFSLLHIEKYLAAAEDLARQAIVTEDHTKPAIRRFEAEAMKSRLDGATGDGEVARLYSRGEVEQQFEVLRAGDYEFRCVLFGDQAGGEVVRAVLFVDEIEVAAFEVPETRGAPGEKRHAMPLGAGPHRLAVAFINDYYDPENPDPKQRDRNCFVDRVDVVGPTDPLPRPFAHYWILGKDGRTGTPARRATPVVENMLERAWRRPVRTEETKRHVALVTARVEAGGTFEEGLRQALTAALASPHFLFRAEPGALAVTASSRPRELDPHALASRLSYFLWSSMPDDRLFELAAQKELGKPEVLRAEVERMLADEKSEALARNFALQWLETRSLLDAKPDAGRFPDFDEELRAAMIEETESFFLAVLREKRPIRDLIQADWTYLNERLARHYGIVGIKGREMRRVPLPPDGRRGGIVAQGAMQVLTSNPNRTSPVKRGKWLLDNLLDSPPPPPPPGADGLISEEELALPATLRERLALHRAKPECATCHARMDALGFALENFDAAGSWRDEALGSPIDAAGELPDGRKINGIGELEAVLLADDSLARALAKKLFIYAIGRPPGEADLLALEALVRETGGLDATIGDLVTGIARLDGFRNRRVSR